MPRDWLVSLALLILNGCASAHADITAGQQVVPPVGFIGYCLRATADCEGGTDRPSHFEMTPGRWSEINRINDYVNRLPQVDDELLYGRAEWWAVATDHAGGDCEDLALRKRAELIKAGWPVDVLLITVVREWNDQAHAVLTVVSDQGDFILDNKSWRIVKAEDAPYRFIKRQARLRPFLWVNLDPANMRGNQLDAVPPLGGPVPFVASVYPNGGLP